VTAGDGLPLLSRTSPRWAASALADPVAFLNDHAHLEKKAAVNALDLLHRWPETSRLKGDPHDDWVMALAAVAKDETAHLHAVARLLKKRGGALTRGHKNPYAVALHEHVRRGRGAEEAMDRLLVSALIEARSCERFEVLAGHAEDGELAALYRSLLSSEKGHFTVFLGLAERIAEPAAVASRWRRFLEVEADAISRQTPGPRMHSGEPS
jgi:tRNA-(ms[2]io[6]A)-hydroxylase